MPMNPERYPPATVNPGPVTCSAWDTRNDLNCVLPAGHTPAIHLDGHYEIPFRDAAGLIRGGFRRWRVTADTEHGHIPT